MAFGAVVAVLSEQEKNGGKEMPDQCEQPLSDRVEREPPDKATAIPSTRGPQITRSAAGADLAPS